MPVNIVQLTGEGYSISADLEDQVAADVLRVIADAVIERLAARKPATRIAIQFGQPS
jgi:hypothetical protein